MSQNIDEILSTILASSPEHRLEHLQLLLKLSQSTPELLRESLRKILRILQITLTDPQVEISLLSTSLVSSFLSLFPDEIEASLTECLASIVVNIGDSQVCNFFLKEIHKIRKKPVIYTARSSQGLA